MSNDTESFNKDLYDLLKVRGYKPIPLDSKNQRVPASQSADVMQFDFIKDGEDYGKVWISIDDASNVIVYYDNEQQNSPSSPTPGVEYNDSWTGFLKQLKSWAMTRQLSFELSNKDRLGDDMRQREYYKMKERVSEGYYPMGKKASYNDAVPNVKIVLQHNRALEEGEQRYRNVAKIYLENVDGERFLAPTTRPGIARVYARHIAEGGLPNDERWNHIKGLCEEYNQMAGFVRATRSKQFNESAQALINEGVSHYNGLRETLGRMTGHRGYSAYFESWTPTLMETDGDDSNVNALFVQETMDPRIESVMPILSRLHKKNIGITEVNELESWADDIVNEHMGLDEAHTGDEAEKKFNKYNDKELNHMLDRAYGRSQPGDAHKQKRAAQAKDAAYNIMWKKKHADTAFEGDEGHTEEENSMAQDNLHKMAKASDKLEKNVKQMGNKKSLEPWQQQLIATAADKVDAVYHSADDDEEVDEALEPWMGKDLDIPSYLRKKKYDDAKQDAELGGPALRRVKDNPSADNDEVEEGLDANQKRVGQLGPTEKVKNNNIGKLVGANESAMNAELKRIMDITRFNR